MTSFRTTEADIEALVQELSVARQAIEGLSAGDPTGSGR
jgi:hypothetical protein